MNSLRFFILFLFTGFSAAAQLAPFTLQVAPVNINCAGNGSVTISVANTTAGSTIQYSLYVLPDVTTPLDQFSESFLPGLGAGNYRIVATQVLGTDSNTAQADFVIADDRVPLDFEIAQPAAASCEDGGTVILNVTSGSPPYLYETTLGPLIVSPQSSNALSGLPGGFYRFRVTDDCGSIAVQDYTLVVGSNNLNVSQGASELNPDCNSITIHTEISPDPGGAIVYPISAIYTIHPPVGPDQVVLQTHASGPPELLSLSLILPLFGDAVYSYDITVTDGCGDPYSGTFEVDPNPAVILSGVPNTCGFEYLTLLVSNFVPPYTVSFTEAPADFIPVNFNADFPGPYADTSISFGTEDNTVPVGNYIVRVTDSCGRFGEAEYLVEIQEPEVTISAIDPNCTSVLGSIRIRIVNRDIVSAVMTAAPPEYSPTPPHDVTSLLDNGQLFMTGLPIGAYVYTIIDSCGFTHEDLDTEIEAFENSNLRTTPRPSCSENFGSLRVTSGNSGAALTSAFITVAPPEFGPTPVEVTSQIVNGALYLNPIPPGVYEITATDTCNFTNVKSEAVVGYNPGVNNYTVEQNCGSYNLTLADQSNIVGQSYWLQQLLDADTNTWGHPQSGEPYPEGTVPDDDNSIELENNETILNLTSTGTFRIVKVYQTNDPGNTNCLHIYESFSFSDDLTVIGAYTLDCEGGEGPDDVYMDVLGIPPYHFTIEEPFFFDNGDSNIFHDLAPGVYTIGVEDSCTNFEPYIINVGSLLPIVSATDPVPGEILVCDDGSGTNATFNLTALTSGILGSQPPAEFTLTYHLSKAEADSGANAIATPEAFVNTSVPQTIYVRVINNRITICYATTSFRLFIGTTPIVAAQLDPVYICDGSTTRIFADSGFDSYEWSTGVTTLANFITVNQSGNYSVIVKNVYGSSSCDATQNITVIGSAPAVIESVETIDWTETENQITVNVSGSGDYTFSLDGDNYQTDNTFRNLLPGIYHVYVRDEHGCGVTDQEVVLLNYPKFFTPNGDGFNDFWNIKFSVYEPGINIYIFDRFGKLMTGFGSRSQGWDGTYNGEQMPSTDYWFMVERIDGTVHRGHFAMKR